MEKIREKIEFNLSRFEKQLDNFDKIRSKNDYFADYNARNLLKSRFLSKQLLEEIQDEKLAKRHEKLEEKFQEKLDDKFIEAAKSELKFSSSKWQEIAKRFLELDPVENELPNDLDYRDTIEIISEFLRKQDATIDGDNVKKSDKEVMKKYCDKIETINEFNISKKYFPEEFWWRHPQKVK